MLEQALSDTNASVRTAAAAALAAYGSAAAISPLERALATESSPSARAQMKSSIEILRSGRGAHASARSRAKYVVQIGNMMNHSGVRGESLSLVLRAAAKERAIAIPGAMVVESSSAASEAASGGRIPLLVLDGSVTRLSEGRSASSVTFSAAVEFSLRRVPEQVLKGTLRGAATSIGSAESLTAKTASLLQDQAVDGAVQSAMQNADQGLRAAAR